MKKPAELGTLVKKKRIVSPPGGWQTNSLYIVEVSFGTTNPVFRTLFHTGFTHDGVPGGYNSFVLLENDFVTEYREAHYLYPVTIVATQKGTLWEKA